MASDQNISRKDFLVRVLGWISMILFGGIGLGITARSRALTQGRKVIIPLSESSGVLFYDDFIVVESHSGIKVYSSRCTHLGCRINKSSEGKLICPCHGSSFDSLTGNPLKGPANRPLEEVEYTINDLKDELIIERKSS